MCCIWHGIAIRIINLDCFDSRLAQKILYGILITHVCNVIRKTLQHRITELVDPHALSSYKYGKCPFGINHSHFGNLGHDIARQCIVWTKIGADLLCQQVCRHCLCCLLIIDLFLTSDRHSYCHIRRVISSSMISGNSRCTSHCIANNLFTRAYLLLQSSLRARNKRCSERICCAIDVTLLYD